jgi:hypothetical protein
MNVKQHVLISKTIWVIFGIILITIFGSEIEFKFVKRGYHLFYEYFHPYRFDIIDILVVPVVIIGFVGPIFLQILALGSILLTPHLNKFNIIKPSYNFHPFYFWYGSWGASYKIIQPSIRSDTFFILVYLPIVFTLGIIFNNEFASIFQINGSIYFTLTIIISIYIITITYRKFKYFPTFILKKAEQIIIETEYINYKKDKSEFPLPFLKEGQEFACKIIEMPRNDEENNTLYIINIDHPENNYLVTKIYDEGLCKLIHEGYILKASLYKIKDNANLQIKLWSEKNNISKLENKNPFSKL